MEQFIANSLEVVLYGEHEAKLSSFANSTLPASLHPLRSTEISKRSPIIVIERDTLPGVSTAGYVISAQGYSIVLRGLTMNVVHQKPALDCKT